MQKLYIKVGKYFQCSKVDKHLDLLYVVYNKRRVLMHERFCGRCSGSAWSALYRDKQLKRKRFTHSNNYPWGKDTYVFFPFGNYRLNNL